MRLSFKKLLPLLLAFALVLPVNMVVPTASAESGSPNIPVLLYHRIVDTATDEWTDTQTDKFRATMKYLNDNGFTTLSSEDYVNIVTGAKAAPAKPILLTFDDGTPGFLHHALPILEEYNMKSIMFLVPGNLQSTPGYYMSHDQIKYIADHHPSVSIENHTWAHQEYASAGIKYWATVSYDDAHESLSDTNDYIKTLTGKDPVLVAYPYGDFNANVKQAAEDLGLRYGFKAFGSNGNGNYEMGRSYIKMENSLTDIASWIGGPTPTDTIGEGKNPNIVYSDSFANNSNVSPAGPATVTAVQNKIFAGNADGNAIQISARSDNWHSFQISLSNKNLVEGQKYELRATLYSDDAYGVEEQQLQAAVITASDAYTQEQFKYLPSKQGTELIVPFTYNDDDSAIRIQLNDAKSTNTFASYYVGELVISGAAPTYTHIAYEETFASGQGITTQSGGPTLSVVDKSFDGNDDSKALSVSNRNNQWDGVDFNVKSGGMNLVAGQKYTVTAVVYLDEQDIIDAELNLDPNAKYQIQMIGSEPNGVDEDDKPKFKETYNTITTTVTEMVYGTKTLTGSFTLKDTDVKLRIASVDGPGNKIPFYIGNIQVSYDSTAKPPRDPALPFVTETFENGQTNGWVGRGGQETLEIVDGVNATDGGRYSLLTSGRESHWNGPALRIEKYLDEGVTYEISAKVKLQTAPEGLTSAPLNLSLDIAGSQWPNLQSKTVNLSDGWVELKGNYRFDDLSSENITVYVETPYNQDIYVPTTYYIDDISIVPLNVGPIEVDKKLPQLKVVYEDDFLIGNAVNITSFNGKVSELLEHHHNLVTAENAMKPDQLQRDKGIFTFETSDAMIEAAKAKGLDVHGHVLVWHDQTPEWMNQNASGNPLSRDEALANMYTHIETVVRHFGTDVISWDVVNEAMADGISNPTDWKNALRKSMWYNSIGPDFVELAFRKAREEIDALNLANGTDIKLFYNDYNEENPNKSIAIYSMIKELNEKYASENNGKLLIDGMGMQAHYNINTRFALVEAALERYISLGVEIGITELDITASDGKTAPTAAQLAAQSILYAKLFKLYKENSEHISRVTLWGIHDEISWRKTMSPLLFDGRLQAKSAFHAAVNPVKYLSENPEVDHGVKLSSAMIGTPTIDGTHDDIWNSTVELPITTFQTAHNVNTGVAKVLWDEKYLYVYAKVNDSELDKSSSEKHEQDSIEIFIDELNNRTLPYGSDDGQYRINFDNETSFNPPSISVGFESATKVDGTTYVVEARIPWKELSPSANTIVGFDIQINDAAAGTRKGVAAWNDSSGQGYNDPSVFGEIKLLVPNTPKPNPNPNPDNNPGPSTPTAADTIKPIVTLQNGVASSTVSATQFNQALANIGSSNKIFVTIDSQQNASSYAIELPAQALNSTANYTVAIQTALGTIDIPSHALVNQNSSGAVKVTISEVDVSTLPENTRNAIGNRPVISLTLSSANEVVPYNNPDAPLTVSIPYTPTAEELANPELIVIWYIDEDGQPSAVANSRYDAASKSVIFNTTHLSDFGIAFSEHQFGDIAHLTWADREISAMAARDIIKGVSATSFNPKADITRADFIALLVRALELQGNSQALSFSDITTTDYFYSELAIASNNGIIENGSGQFNPKESLTREEMIVLAAKAIKAANKKLPSVNDALTFKDEQSISEDAREAVKQLTQAGIVKGRGDNLAPLDLLNRAEAAVILYRIWSL